MRVNGTITLADDTTTEFSVHKVAGAYCWSQWGGSGQPKRFIDVLGGIETAVIDYGPEADTEETDIRERINDARAALAAWYEAAEGDSDDAEHEAGLQLAELVESLVADYRDEALG